MTTSSQLPSPGDVILVRFDFMDRTDSRIRPSGVLSSRQFNQSRGYFVFTQPTGSAGSYEDDDSVETRDVDLAGPNRRSYSQGILATANNRDLRCIVGNLSGGICMQMTFSTEVVARGVGCRWPPYKANTATDCRS